MSNWGLAQAARYVVATDTTSVVSAATAHTKGAWAQLSAAAPANVHGIALARWQHNGAPRALIDISIGASGAEADHILIANLVMTSADEYRAGCTQQYIPISIPEGARVSARLSTHLASTITCKLRLSFMQANGLTPIGSGSCSTYGANVGTTTGTMVQCGGDGGYSTQTEFVASLPLPVRGVAIAMCHAASPGSNYGSNIRARVMVNDQNLGLLWNFAQFDGNETGSNQMPTFYPCYMPAGAKVGLTGTNQDGYTPTRPFILYLLH